MARSNVPLEAAADREERRRKQLETPVAEIGLDVRTTEVLEQHGVLLVVDLLRLGREDLLAIDHLVTGWAIEPALVGHATRLEVLDHDAGLVVGRAEAASDRRRLELPIVQQLRSTASAWPET